MTIKARTGTGDKVVCYRLPDQYDQLDEALYSYIEIAGSSWTFNLPITMGGTTEEGISNTGGPSSALLPFPSDEFADGERCCAGPCS